MRNFLLFPCILLAASLAAQSPANDPKYKRAVEIGLGELQKGQCLPCIEAYEHAFALSKHSALSHLRAARCAQLCNDPAKARAFADKAVEIAFSTAEKVLDSPAEYPELKPLNDSELGREIREKIAAAAKAAGFDRELAKALDALREEDQRPRNELDVVRSKYDKDAPEFQQFIRDWAISDSLCLLKAEAIIARHGYPGKTLVGEERQDIIWLVLQHAPLEKQEHYYPLLEDAANKGEMRKSSLAYLLDRIRMRKGLPQVYGSQVVRDEATGGWKFHPIEDEANVNKRRAEVGLGPIEEYALQMGVR
jgi:hypothetical protein